MRIRPATALETISRRPHNPAPRGNRAAPSPYAASTTMTTSTFPHFRIGLLGLTTIAVYGTWYYAFGVLLDPIIADTGWSEAGLAATFTGGAILVGGGALAGGWLLDRFGSRQVFLAAALIGGGGIIGTSHADSFGTFAALGILGSGALGGLSFYHITQTTVVRITPDAPTRAIARLTIWGALSSPIYLPLTAWLVENYHWRTAIRVLVIPAIVLLVIVAIFAPAHPTELGGSPVLRSVLRMSRENPEIRRFLLASGLMGMGFSIVLVYQVPVMTSLGMPLTAAASVAGLRGFCQLLGRLPLFPIVSRLGVRASTRLALGALFAGFLLLLGSGSLAFGIAFAVVAGFGVGAISPLQGMYTAELFESEALGSAMGLVTVLYASFGALGPAIVGILSTATGSRLWAVAIGAGSAALAAAILSPRRLSVRPDDC